MKILYCAAFTLSFGYMNIVATAQTTDWVWAQSTGGPGSGNGVSTDAKGNVYVTGYFSDSNNVVGKYNLVAGFFLAKYDALGNVIWAKGIGSDVGSDNFISGNGISTDLNGNSYVTGSTNANAAFIGKFDTDGNLVWWDSPYGSGNSKGTGISIGPGGHSYITGYFYGTTLLFGGFTLTNSGTNGQNMFIVEYDSTGNVVWAQCAGGTDNAVGGYSVTADTNGNSYVTGGFLSNSLILGTFTLEDQNVGDDGMFLAKYDTAGNVIWAESPTGAAAGFSISQVYSGNIYVGEKFASQEVIFGKDTFDNTDNNVYLVKYNLNGHLIWGTGPSGAANINGVNADARGNSYITGTLFSSTLIFGNETLNSNGDENTFVAKYNSAGSLIWAEGAGGTGNCISGGMATDTIGNVYITGGFNSYSDTFGNNTISGQAVFVAKFGEIIATGVPMLNNPNSINVFPNPTTGAVYFNGVQPGNTLQVYNVLGEIIYTGTVDRNNYNINISGKAKGVYFYRVADGATFVQEGKIVVE